MNDAVTCHAKYIFLDVVRFSTGRSVEAQTEIVHALNEVVRGPVREHLVSAEEVIFLPTGDGICIGLLSPTSPYDIHLRIALDILARICDRNYMTEDPMRKFDIRIGVNENVDNIVTDINNNRNVAGAGINVAQRVMNFADEGQIIVGQTVFETLSQREKYMKSFRPFQALAKHGEVLRVYQFIGDGHRGVNVKIPSAFVPKERREERLTLYEAYYFANAIRHRDFFVTKASFGGDLYTGVVLLHFLAEDCEDLSESSDIRPHHPKAFGKGKATVEQQFAYYTSVDYWMRCEWAHVVGRRLSHLETYFERTPGYLVPIFVNDQGRKSSRMSIPIYGRSLVLARRTKHASVSGLRFAFRRIKNGWGSGWDATLYILQDPRIWVRMADSFSGLPSGPKASTLRQNFNFASHQSISGASCRK